MTLRRVGLGLALVASLFGNQPAAAETSGLPRSYMSDKISKISDTASSQPEEYAPYPRKRFYSGFEFVSAQQANTYSMNGYVQLGMSNKYPVTRYFISAKEDNAKLVNLTEFIRGGELGFSRTSVSYKDGFLVVVKGGQKGLNGLVARRFLWVMEELTLVLDQILQK